MFAFRDGSGDDGGGGAGADMIGGLPSVGIGECAKVMLGEGGADKGDVSGIGVGGRALLAFGAGLDVNCCFVSGATVVAGCVEVLLI